MRSILTVSLPASEKRKISIRAKKAGKSVSGYILYIIHLAEEMIQEEELVRMARQAEKDYFSGKTKVLKSLANLK